MSDREIKRLLLMQAIGESLPDNILDDGILTTEKFTKKFKQALAEVDEKYVEDEPENKPIQKDKKGEEESRKKSPSVTDINPSVGVSSAPPLNREAGSIAQKLKVLSERPIPLYPEPKKTKEPDKPVVTPREEPVENQNWSKRLGEIEAKFSKTEKCLNNSSKPVDWTEVDIKGENGDPVIRRSKTEILRKLYRSYGGIEKANNLGIGMLMSLAELRFEEQSREEAVEEDETIISFIDWAKILFGVLEKINAKCGNLLKLDGWADSMTPQMHRFDRPFRLLYRRYYGKRKANPIYDILFVLVSSIFMYHIGHRRITETDHNTNQPSSESAYKTAPQKNTFPPPPRTSGNVKPSSGAPDMANLFGMMASSGLFK